MNQVTIDPAPEEWFTQERRFRLKAAIGTALPLLIRSDVLVRVIDAWIRIELGETESDMDSSFIWARSQWGHRLDSLFLQKKDQLDQASCKLIRVRQPGLALELYHRVVANEASFEELSQQYGVGKERFNGGLINQQPLSSFPAYLSQLLRKLQPGEVSKPFRMGSLHGFVQLEAFVPAIHGEASEALLLKQELQHWIKAMSEHLAGLLSSTD